MLENTSNQPTKFRAKNWVKINDEFGTFNTNSQIKFKISMLRSSSCDYSNGYILVKRTKTVANTETAAAANNAVKKVIFENFAPFTSCVSRINNTEIDDVQYIDVVMSMYNLIDDSDNYLKIFGILWQYCRDKLAVNDDGAITDFPEANATTDSLSLKEKLTGQTGNSVMKNVEIMVPLKYLSNFGDLLKCL